MGYSTGLDQERSVQHLPHTSLPEGQVLGQQLPASPLLVRGCGAGAALLPRGRQSRAELRAKEQVFPPPSLPPGRAGSTPIPVPVQGAFSSSFGAARSGGDSPNLPKPQVVRVDLPPPTPKVGCWLPPPSPRSLPRQALSSLGSGDRTLPSACCGLRGEKEKREQPKQGAIKVNCFYCRFNSVL